VENGPRTELQQRLFDALSELFGEFGEAMPHLSKNFQGADGTLTRMPMKYVSKGLFTSKKEVYESLVKSGVMTTEECSLPYFRKAWRWYVPVLCLL
jgi:hypothetical protein